MSRSRSLATILMVLGVFAATAAAQPDVAAGDYRLGAGDVVQLNVLQQPTLDRSLLIRPDGSAVIPLVGEVELEGLTLTQAEELVRQKLRLFNHDIVDISLTVTEYNALRVYVLGAVVSPGSFTFDSSPTLWDVIREAGGADPGANLAAVRVISISDNTTTTQTYDLSGLVAGTGGAPQVFLRAGDTVIVPGEEALTMPTDSSVQVFGGVASPGIYTITEPTPLMTVLMLAGAPLEAAELKKVWWVHADNSGRFDSRLVDLSKFIEEGETASNPLIHPGDTIEVERSQPGFFRTVYPLILGTISTAAAIIFTVDRIGSN